MKKFARRIAAVAMSFTMSIALLSPALAASNENVLSFPIGSVNYTLNGSARPAMPVAPFVSDAGRTMLPARFVAEAMGAEVGWDAAARSVLIDGVPMFTIGSAIYVGGDYMGTPEIVDDRTFVPFRYLAESLGGVVEWDGGTRTAYIFFGGDAPATPPVTTPPAADDFASGNVGRLQLGTNWASMELRHPFTSGQYTIALAFRGEGLSIGPAQDPWFFADNPLASDQGLDDPTVWHHFTETFNGAATGGGIQISSHWDETEDANGDEIGRTIGSVFHVDNIVITNAAGTEVVNIDFESGDGGIEPAAYSESTFTVVPMP